MSDAVLFNGGSPAAGLALHRGLQYGDGVFRTCFIYDSQVIDIQQQINKIAQDATRLGIAAAPAEMLAAEAASLAQGQARGVLKMLLLRAGRDRGYRSDAQAADRLVCRYPAPAYPAAAWEQGVRAARADLALAAQPALAGIKHLNRLEQVLASRHWPQGADELLVADDAGRPVGGTRSNLFWVRQGVLRTPALDRCGVAGLMRDKVLALAPTLHLRVDVAAGSWAELAGADEAFVTNSLIGIWPLAVFESQRWPAPGPVTRRLSDALRHPRLTA